MKNSKILFCASAGGHFTELLQFKEVMLKYDSIIITEKMKIAAEPIVKTHYVPYSSRNEGFIYLFKYSYVILLSLIFFLKFRPAVVISTGAHSTIPVCVFAWIFKRKVIYVETVAAVKKPTLTGRFMSKIATEFYVQWEELLAVYPKATYGGVLF